MKNICLYNKYGYCKFTGKCKRIHIKDLCESFDCEGSTCQSRHPKTCKYYEEFQFCKFGQYCRCSHKAFAQKKEQRNFIKQLEKENAEKDTQIENLKMELTVINSKYLQLKRDNSELEIKTINEFKGLRHEIDELNETIGVTEMLFDNFKQEMHDTYGHVSQVSSYYKDSTDEPFEETIDNDTEETTEAPEIFSSKIKFHM